jgi:hypothetical protein
MNSATPPTRGTDPNGDLIGHLIPGVGTVTGSALWSSQFVYVTHPIRPGVTKIRAANLVRRHKESLRLTVH